MKLGIHKVIFKSSVAVYGLAPAGKGTNKKSMDYVENVAVNVLLYIISTYVFPNPPSSGAA